MVSRQLFTASDPRWLFARLAGLFLLFLTVCPALHAHSDLSLQIDELSRQLESEPDNPELLLRRGDLQRRHENWDLARADFTKVREVQPENPTVDWFEGRMEVEAGRPLEGVELLDRFLLTQPHQAIALQNRAQGYLQLELPLLAARDLQTVIRVSDNPAPALYSASALAFVAAGPDYFPDAMIVSNQGLSIFPGEIVLTGIATDLSLAQADTDTASQLIGQLPDSIQNLPQWQTRILLLDCQSGGAPDVSSALKASPASRSSSGLLSEESLTRLTGEPSAEDCQAAALAILTGRLNVTPH